MQTISTAAGERLIVLTEEECDDLTDLRDAHQAMADLKAGSTETYSEEEVRADLDAPTPLAHWRERRGMERSALAKSAPISTDTLAALESGKHVGDVAPYAWRALRLRTRVGDIIPAERADDMQAVAAQ